MGLDITFKVRAHSVTVNSLFSLEQKALDWKTRRLLSQEHKRKTSRHAEELCPLYYGKTQNYTLQ
jgi:hypothetical protein